MDVTGVDFGIIAALAAVLLPIVWKVVDFVKYASAGDKNAVTTQGVVMVVAVALTFLFAQTAFASSFDLGTESLATLNWASLLFIGISIGAGTSVGVDVKKAIDNRDSAATPALMPSSVKVVDATTGESVSASGLVTAPSHLRDESDTDGLGDNGYKTTDLP